jgi:hypothetical protein
VVSRRTVRLLRAHAGLTDLDAPSTPTDLDARSTPTIAACTRSDAADRVVLRNALSDFIDALEALNRELNHVNEQELARRHPR